MSSEASHDRQRGLSEEATRWLVLLQSGELSVEQRAAFVDWLRESPTHIAELLHIGELESELAALPVWRSLAPLAEQPSNVVSLDARSRATPQRPAMSAWFRRAAAACLILVLATAYLAFGHRGELRLRTMPGEHSELALEDGSVLNLGPDSDVAVRYDARRRSIVLARGQATFRVARNPQRPFIVEAAGTQVRAVGTVFNVERGERGVLVSVVEGHVAVTPGRPLSATLQSRPTPAIVNLNPDEEIVVSAAGEASPVRLVQRFAHGSTPGATLSFENETVADVAQKFNARNSLYIDVRDPGVARRRISGVFYADDPESFIAFVAAVMDADVRRESGDRVLIGAR